MRKEKMSPPAMIKQHAKREWMDLDKLARVEYTSEDPAYPIESAMIPEAGPGWRSGQPGAQTICLRFDRPQQIQCIKLLFEEHELPRTQEFVLRWFSSSGVQHELLRQQFNFSPPNTSRESEEYEVDLEDVSMLELMIIPDISGGGARASLVEIRVAGGE